MDTHNLAVVGFTTIRNLLSGRIKGGTQAALDLAEALHNLPDPDNDFTRQLTIRRLQAVIRKHPTLTPTFEKFLP